MTIAKTGLLIINVLIMLAGLIFMAQGSGLFPYPSTSFMINQTPWIWGGAIATVVGAVGIYTSRHI